MTKISRRSFARTAIVAATAAALPNVPIHAETAAPAKTDPEVEARIQWIFTKYGSRLNDEQRADIRRIIASGQAGVDDMRKYALDNAIEPAEAFRVYRKAAKK